MRACYACLTFIRFLVLLRSLIRTYVNNGVPNESVNKYYKLEQEFLYNWNFCFFFLPTKKRVNNNHSRDIRYTVVLRSIKY